MSSFSMGDRVVADSKSGKISGVGTVEYEGGESGDVYTIDFGPYDVGLFYGEDITLDEPETHIVELAYVFRAPVSGLSEFEATEAFRTALVEHLTWDGDDDAPEVLAELEMRSIPVPEKVPA